MACGEPNRDRFGEVWRLLRALRPGGQWRQRSGSANPCLLALHRDESQAYDKTNNRNLYSES